MTTFVLKIIAILTMFIDHFAAYLILSGSDLFSENTLYFMRSIGRMSLPIFAYFIVVGYSKTSDLKKYISRIHLFAIISQIPFIMAFDFRNYFGSSMFKLKGFSYNWTGLIFVLVIIVAYYIFICDKKWDKSIVFVAIAYLITPIFLSYQGKVLLASNNLNIFYEFGISLILISMMERIQFLKDNSIEFLVIDIISIMAIYYYIGSIANYDYFGMLLVLVLRMLKTSKKAQIASIIIWGILMYQTSLESIGFVVLASILLYFYNGKKGQDIKYLFYIFYPMHLLVFGLNTFLK